MSSVLITGASRGIGRAAALALDREGHEVMAGVRGTEAAERLAAEASDRLRTARLDVTDASSVPVDKVAAAVVEAVTAERPRTRYVVGADARGQALIERLPARARDRLLRLAFGI